MMLNCLNDVSAWSQVSLNSGENNPHKTQWCSPSVSPLKNFFWPSDQGVLWSKDPPASEFAAWSDIMYPANNSLLTWKPISSSIKLFSSSSMEAVIPWKWACWTKNVSWSQSLTSKMVWLFGGTTALMLLSPTLQSYISVIWKVSTMSLSQIFLQGI